MAVDLGFSSGDATLIAAAISELARNIISYARKGEVFLQEVHGSKMTGMRIVATDMGPGIRDISQALRDGFSTSGSLGIGLPGVRRLMDEFEIASQPGRGTTVTVKKWKNSQPVGGLRGRQVRSSGGRIVGRSCPRLR
jgi:serine/threonine-protein kinase RsbT